MSFACGLGEALKNWSVNLGTVADTVVVVAWGGDPLDIAAAVTGVVAAAVAGVVAVAVTGVVVAVVAEVVAAEPNRTELAVELEVELEEAVAALSAPRVAR